MPTLMTNLARSYNTWDIFNLTDINIILTDDMDHQSVNKENSFLLKE
jgi:hypothetical protein